jgi:hypothetical protein
VETEGGRGEGTGNFSGRLRLNHDFQLPIFIGVVLLADGIGRLDGLRWPEIRENDLVQGACKKV